MIDVYPFLTATIDALSNAGQETKFVGTIERAAERIIDALRNGNKILICGNGGSAAMAQHMATELVGRYQRERPGLAAIALTADSALLTALANDYGYERVFSRQVVALGKRGDVLVAMSTSGSSKNVAGAVRAALFEGLYTIGLGGRRFFTVPCDLMIAAPADDTPIIQQLHLFAIHAICGLVEHGMFPEE